MDKSEYGMMGAIILTFVAVIVALSLFIASADQVGQTATTAEIRNTTYTFPAVGSYLDLKGQELLSTPVVYNSTGGESVPASNYTIAEGVSTTTGVKTVRLLNLGGNYTGSSVNISYTYGVDGYIEDSGSKAIAGLIVIFAALAIGLIALVPTLRSGVVNMITR